MVNAAPQKKAPRDQHPDLPPVIIANRGGVENPELDSSYWVEEAQKIVRAQTNRRINSSKLIIFKNKQKEVNEDFNRGGKKCYFVHWRWNVYSNN